MNIKLYYSALLTIFILSGCAADNGLIYSPDMAIFYKTRGESYYAEENYDLALADYNKAIEIYPRLVSAYILRARIYKEQENYDFALADYNRAAKINPNIYYVYLNRAEIYQQKKEYDLALADYNKAIKVNPKMHDVYRKRAEIYQQKKEYDFALADYTKAIELNPSPNYYRGRGSVYYMKKQYDSAVKEYTKAIKLNNYYAPAYNDLAWLLATCGDEKYRDSLKAVEFANKAVELAKKTGHHLAPESQVFNTLAAAYAEAGDFDMAVKSQEKAIQLKKENGNSDHLDDFEKRLESYKRNIPWRDM